MAPSLAARRLATLALLAAACAKGPQVQDSTPPVAAAPDPTLTLESAAVVSGRVTVTFTIADGGKPVSLATAKALTPAFTLAFLDKEPVTQLPAWTSLLLLGSQVIPSLPPAGPGTPATQVLANRTQPGAEMAGGTTGGTLAEVGTGQGRFTYTFFDLLRTDLVNTGTRMRVGTYLRGVTTGTERTARTLDFAPNGAVLPAYGVVRQENCVACHGLLKMHGNRISGVDFCVTCHTWQLADPDTADPAAMLDPAAGVAPTAARFPNPLELGRFVHRIHRGKKLPTLYLASSGATWPTLPFNAVPPLPYLSGRNATAPVGTKFNVIGRYGFEFVFGRIVSRIDNFQPAKTVAAGVGYPQDLRNCDACHGGAPNADVIGRAASANVRISRRTCAGCHPDVLFGYPDALGNPITVPDATHLAHTGGAQPDDSLCADCHVRNCPSVDPTGCGTRKLWAPIAEIHRPLNDRLPAASPRWSRFHVDIVDVQNMKAGQAPTVRYKVYDRVGAISPLNAPTPAYETPSATSSPGPRAISLLGIVLSGPTGEYHSDNVNLRGTPPLDSVADANGVFSYTFNAAVQKLPADASGTWAVGTEGRRRPAVAPPFYTPPPTDTFNWPYTGEVVNEYPTNDVRYVDVATGTLTTDPSRVRRAVVSQSKCEACHGELNLHGANRHDVAHCLLCHAPDATDWDKRPRDTRTLKDDGVNGTGQVLLSDPINAAATGKRWGYATRDGIEESTIHFKVMVHRIHTGEREGAASLEGIRPYVIYAMSYYPSLPPNPYFFDEVRFPRDLANCEACHLSGTWRIESIPAGAQPTVANETGSIRHVATFNADGTVKAAAGPAHAASGEGKRLPIAATCLSCHTNGAAVDHAAGKTVGAVEQCGTCHGENGADSVRRWHAVP